MSAVKMVMFDLSGTTVQGDTAVCDCIYQAARAFDLETTPDEILHHMGTNKIHLFQFLITRSRGHQVDIKNFKQALNTETLTEAQQVFKRYEALMIDHYRSGVREIAGASDTFRWCHDHGIKVATDTGFHGAITDAVMEGLGWLRSGLVDLSVHVECIPGGRGRPAPYMIFYAMQKLNIQSVHAVIKVGDTPADMLEGYNAGCSGVVGVLSGPRPIGTWGKYRHTHIIESVKDLPGLLTSEFI
jgi:phosphonatase-like hydrolase